MGSQFCDVFCHANFVNLLMEQSEIPLGRHSLLPFRQLNFDGCPVRLGNKALQILSTLAAANGRIVTMGELMNTVWSGLIVEDNAVQVHVAALRKALGSDARLLVTVRGIGYRLEDGRNNSISLANFKKIRSIAVLAFVNMTGNREMDYLGEGMAEELINSLSRTPGLTVSSRTSSFAYKNRNVDARDICEQLGVDAMVEGSVRIAGEFARVTAQLISSENGAHIWSKNFDHEFSDLFELQGDITAMIVQSLQRFIAPAQTARII
jgi:TolB-like protein